jgi:glutamate-1-semialdehyde 2,1-aminomutase
MAAGLAMLSELDSNRGIFESIDKKSEYLHKGIDKVLKAQNIDFSINRVGSMISVHFGEERVVDFESASKSAGNGVFNKFFHGMLAEGIYLAPSAYETWFISEALSYEDLDATIAAAEKVAASL